MSIAARLRALLLLALVGASLAACGAGTLHSEKERESAPALTAQELYRAYRKDEAAADALYKGRLLKVSGVADYSGTDLILEAPEVILTGGGKDASRGVDCVFDPRYEDKVAKVAKGDALTVLGRCEGFYKINVLLRDCEPLAE